MNFVHVSRFVEFNSIKIRGRVFAKKGKMQQVSWSCGNTSKLINLVSLFNIWVWFIMQVRAFILTCLMILGNMVSKLSQKHGSVVVEHVGRQCSTRQ